MSRLRKAGLFSVVLLLLVVGMAPVAGTASAITNSQPDGVNDPCESLIGLSLPDTTSTLAAVVEPGTVIGSGRDQVTVPVQMCRVAGYLTLTSVSHINFEVWMPTTTWNGKYNGVGNGGLAGSISYPAMGTALGLGYATASTDTGHKNSDDPATWAIGHPYPPEKLVDFASRSIHLTAVAAKALIAAYYGEPAEYSYFTGCSGGGGQALSEAQRFPEDYDGIVAGAPANFPTHMWPGELYAAWVNRSNPTNDANSYIITQDKLPIINAAAVAACDAKDGLKDGLIDDPRLCRFDPTTIVCKKGQTADCITAEQAEVVKKVYAGLYYSTSDKKFGPGKMFWPGYEPGSEFQWWGHIGDPFGIPKTYFQYMVWDNNKYPGYPQDTVWQWNTFDFSLRSNFNNVLYPASADLGRTLDSKNTDLSAFMARGGKLIMWHGWNDQNIAPRNSIAYYTAMVVATKWGRAKKGPQEFAHLFMVPGMQHCNGGPGPNTFDTLAALDQWVANGIAPDKIIASHSTGGVVDFTRPLCPYPQVARWTGKGDWKDAANWVCKTSGQGISAGIHDPANELYEMTKMKR